MTFRWDTTAANIALKPALSSDLLNLCGVCSLWDIPDSSVFAYVCAGVRDSETDDSSSLPMADRTEISPGGRKLSIHLNLPDFHDGSTGAFVPPVRPLLQILIISSLIHTLTLQRWQRRVCSSAPLPQRLTYSGLEPCLPICASVLGSRCAA